MNPWEMQWEAPPWERQWSAVPEKTPAEETGVLQSMLIGAGRTFDKIGARGQQLYYGAQQALGLPDADRKQAQLAAQQAEADRLYQPMQQAHPIAANVGEVLPAFAVPVGGGASALGNIARMAIPGVIQAAATYASPEDTLKNAAIQGAGGALGGAALMGLGKVASPAMKLAGEGLDRFAQTAQEAGINLTPAQLTGGKFAQGVEAALNTLPFTAGKQGAIKEAQQEAYNAALLSKALGADAAKASPDVLADAAAKIGAKFDAGVEGVTVPVNKTAQTYIDSIGSKYAERLDSMQKPIVGNIIADLKGAGDSLSGQQYHSIVSDLAAAARNVTDKQTERALLNLRTVLDASYKAAAPAEKSAAYFEARGQYKHLLTIEDALKNSRSQGDIPAKSMYAAFQKVNPNFVRGAGGEVGDLVRAGRQFLPDPTPNSGTAYRAAFANLLSGGLGAGGSALTGGDPIQGFAYGVAAPYLLSKSAQAVYNSPLTMRYLQNGLLSDEAKRLLMRGGGLLGAGTALSTSP